MQQNKKLENYNSLEKKVISLNQKVSNLQFKIKDYEKNELLHIKEIEQLKKETQKDSVYYRKAKYREIQRDETIQAQALRKRITSYYSGKGIKYCYVFNLPNR